jgi:hypothetical protein
MKEAKGRGMTNGELTHKGPLPGAFSQRESTMGMGNRYLDLIVMEVGPIVARESRAYDESLRKAQSFLKKTYEDTQKYHQGKVAYHELEQGLLRHDRELSLGHALLRTGVPAETAADIEAAAKPLHKKIADSRGQLESKAKTVMDTRHPEHLNNSAPGSANKEPDAVYARVMDAIAPEPVEAMRRIDAGERGIRLRPNAEQQAVSMVKIIPPSFAYRSDAEPEAGGPHSSLPHLPRGAHLR